MQETRGDNEARIIAVSNQKGGVGKTTTTINLAAGLADMGYRCLIVDLDPQGNASTGLGISAEDRSLTTYDLLAGSSRPQDIIRKTGVENVWISPATQDLASADIDLISTDRRTFLLRKVLRGDDIRSSRFDYILIDCPPSLNLLTVNAMVAADSVLVPLQSEFFALEGLSQLMLTIREIRQTANNGLRIEGVVLTMFDGRNNLSQMVEQDARDALGDLVFDTIVPRAVRVSEAPSYSMPVIHYDPLSKGSVAYRALAQEVVDRRKRTAA